MSAMMNEQKSINSSKVMYIGITLLSGGIDKKVNSLHIKKRANRLPFVVADDIISQK